VPTATVGECQQACLPPLCINAQGICGVCDRGQVASASTIAMASSLVVVALANWLF